MDGLKKQLDTGAQDGEIEEKSAFLTYMLSQDTLTPTEVSSTMVDMMMAAVETVRWDAGVMTIVESTMEKCNRAEIDIIAIVFQLTLLIFGTKFDNVLSIV